MEKKIYILKNGSEYIGDDYASGGYPYSSKDIFSAKRFDSPEKPLAWLGSSINQYPAARTVRLVAYVEEVDQTEIAKALREAALGKLSDAEKKALGL
jgi:hypothetical protein